MSARRQVRILSADQRGVASRRTVILLVQCAIAIATVTLGALVDRPTDWRPLELMPLLLVLTIGSDLMMVQARGIRISGAFLGLVLAMALLGPGPAGLIGAASAAIDAVVSRRSWERALNNVVTYAAFPVLGGAALDLLDPGVQPASQPGLGYAGAVLVVFMATNLLNFTMVAAFHRARFGAPFGTSVRTVYLTVLPSEFATGLLTAGVAFSYGRLGMGAIALAAVVLFVFQYLLRAGIHAFERGEELEQRTRELAALQVGLLTTVLQTLSMRDAMTARHSAAVARYAREVARMLGLPEREQELIHTAALLHDIGKFIFPDSILFADRKLTDEEWEVVKLHPEQGARLVAQIEGYGPVAEIIRHHHERFAGGGYPCGIAAQDIPLGSRIISVADTYDVMTSRDSYRRPVSAEAALAELRRVAGTQLDPQVVETFERMILERRVAFSHVDATDFESELAFDRRVADYARPRLAA
jgi:putative nucleotidyltransferase with HDIG domain